MFYPRRLSLFLLLTALPALPAGAQDDSPPTGPDLLAACGVSEPSARPYPAEAEIPGVEVPVPRLETHLTWPARPTIDDAGTLPAPADHSVIASLPAIRPNGDTAGWFAILVPGLPATMDEWSANPALAAVWLPTGGEPVELFTMASSHLPPMAQRWGGIRVEGDRLAMICLPSYVGSEGPDEWVEGYCVTFLDYLSEAPAGAALETVAWPGFDHQRDLTLRDLNGDGAAELLRWRAWVTTTPGSSELTPVAADDQPLWTQARTRLAVRYNDAEAERAALEGAHEQIGALIAAIYPEPLPQRTSCVDRAIAERLVWLVQQADEPVWPYIQTTLDPRVHRPAVERMGVLPARRLDWPMPSGTLDATPAVARWEGDDAVIYGIPGAALQTCDASGCLSGETVSAPALDLSPDGALRFRCLAAFDWGWTSFVVLPGSQDPTIVNTWEDPCACGLLDPNGDERGFFVRARAAASPPNNEDDSPCSLIGPAISPGLGFAGWLAPDAFLWVNGTGHYRVSTSAHTAEWLPSEDVPGELRPLAGLTADGRYLFYMDNSGVAAVWRYDSQTGAQEMVGTIGFDLADTPLSTDSWDMSSLEYADSPGSYAIPSPNGRRLWVIANGVPRGVWELPQ